LSRGQRHDAAGICRSFPRAGSRTGDAGAVRSNRRPGSSQAASAIYSLFTHDLLASGTRVIATSPDDLGGREFGTPRPSGDRGALTSVGSSVPLWDRFFENLAYAQARPSEGNLAGLSDAIRSAEAAGATRSVFYLAVPPQAFPGVTAALVDQGLCEHARLVYDKPFGESSARFRNLLTMVRTILGEEQSSRSIIPLAKEAARRIMQMRFAGPLSEREWSCDTIDQVQIDVPETIGVGTRGGFYEQTGALKDYCDDASAQPVDDRGHGQAGVFGPPVISVTSERSCSTQCSR
jgi:glucose-6-phosphate 1-dehydrogenase